MVGVLEPEGEDGDDGGPTETVRFRRASLPTTVILLETGIRWGSSCDGATTPDDGAAVGDLGAEKELYLRSFPRPASGAGPASVSSQSLSRNPIIAKNK